MILILKPVLLKGFRMMALFQTQNENSGFLVLCHDIWVLVSVLANVCVLMVSQAS